MKNHVVLLTLSALLLALCACKESGKDPRGEMTVVTTPAEATVNLLGADRGKTPFRCKIHPGTYRLKVSKQGFEPEWRNIKLETGKKMEIRIPLKPVSAHVLLESVPVGAVIHFNGTEIGAAPVVLRDLPAGHYKATMKIPGYARKTVEWTVDSARPKHVKMELVSNLGTLNISSVPTGAKLTINGKPSGKTPYSGKLEQGNYKVAVEYPGYALFEQTAPITKSSGFSVVAQLSPLPGKLKISSAPAGAAINLNGKNHGKTPLDLQNLTPGTYRISVSKAGFDAAEKTVVIGPGGEASAHFKMDSNTGGIDFVTTPPGVTVYLNSKKMGATENGNDSDLLAPSKVFSIRDLKPGKYTLMLTHKRAKPSQKKLQITVKKGKIERLKPINIWLANATLTLSTGARHTGVYIAKLKDGSVMFSPEPGVTYTYKSSEVQKLKMLNIKE